MASRFGTNTGHGHVWTRPDGVKARCGGPGMCSVCSADKEHVEQANASQVPFDPKPIAGAQRMKEIRETLVSHDRKSAYEVDTQEYADDIALQNAALFDELMRLIDEA